MLASQDCSFIDTINIRIGWHIAEDHRLRAGAFFYTGYEGRKLIAFGYIRIGDNQNFMATQLLHMITTAGDARLAEAYFSRNHKHEWIHITLSLIDRRRCS